MAIDDGETVAAVSPAGASGPPPVAQTELVVFDFDQTIINCESDLFLANLAPGGVIPDQLYAQVQDDPECIRKMQLVFAFLYEEANIREEDYKRCLAKMPFVTGLDRLLTRLGQNASAFEVIIVSDANTYFIDYFLAYHQLDHVVKKVFTNPAHFDPAGLLQLSRCHKPQHWCDLSPPNLCKGQVIKEYIAQREADAGLTFARVNYVGDGQNDLCPSLRLAIGDRVFPRVGFTLDRLLKEKVKEGEVDAAVYPFESGDDIWSVLIGGE